MVHQYKLNGFNIVLDTCSGSVHTVDDVAYDIIAMYENTDAEKIVANGTKYYIEVSNMPTTDEAMAYLKKNNVIIAPSKAVNAGGVSVSGLEMSQNSMRYSWSAEEVDEKLQGIMKNIFEASLKAANQYGFGDDLVAGANIAGFIKVAEAMLAQGVV